MANNNGNKVLNAPPLRFPEFSGEWKEQYIREAATIEKGSGISKDQLSEEGEPCILYGELYTKYKSEIISDVVSKTNIDTKKLTRSKANDVIIPCSGETAIDIATARCVPNDGILLGGDLSILRFNSHDGAFISYQLNGKRKYDIARVAQGVSVVHLYPEHLKGIKIFAPTLEEQQKIVRFLAKLDERIATQIGLIEDLKKLKSAINDQFHDNCEGESISFSEIGESYSGLSGKSGEDFGNGAPFITYMNVYENDVVDDTKVDYVHIGEREKQNKVKYGDLLFSLSSETPEEVGIGAVFLGESGKYFLNSFCFGIHINVTDKVYPPYLAYLVSCTRFRKFVYPLAQGSTRFNLQKNDFMRKKFILPNVHEQKRIAKTLDAITAKLRVEEKLLEAFTIQRRYLLRMMFI